MYENYSPDELAEEAIRVNQMLQIKRKEFYRVKREYLALVDQKTAILEESHARQIDSTNNRSLERQLRN